MKKLRFISVFLVLSLVFSAAAFAITAEQLAAKHRVKLWSFESGTAEGWHGAGQFTKRIKIVKSKHATDGQYCMKVDLTGSVDWNQDIMLNDGPFDSSINRLVEFNMDVYIPEASVTL